MRNARAITIVALFALLFYTRFVGLDWGLPYPMHPDERNMADAMVRMRCDDVMELPLAVYSSLTNPSGSTDLTGKFTPQCLNPHFFAYGQFPLYIGKLLAIFVPEAAGSFTQSVIALRLIAAIASCVSFVFMLRIAHRLLGERIRSVWTDVALGLLFIFSPILIQLAHYGTTESLLMMLYLMIVWWSLKLYDTKQVQYRSLLWLGVLSGLALGTKVSAAPYLLVPLAVLGIRMLADLVESHTQMRAGGQTATNDPSIVAAAEPQGDTESLKAGNPTVKKEFLIETSHIVGYVSAGIFFLLVSGIMFVLSSPYNIISPNEFFSSMRYESDIGLGVTVAFYTRQFLYELPVIFQARSILPYVLGWGVLLMALAGFALLPWRDKRMNTVRLAILFVALPTVFMYAKWTRFLAPIYPLLIVLAGVFLICAYEWARESLSSHQVHQVRQVKGKSFNVLLLNLLVVSVVALSIAPGIGMLAVYQHQDVRLTASEWMYRHIPTGSVVLSETANVIDLPISSREVVPPVNYLVQNTSFDYYKVDEDPAVAAELERKIASAEYIVVPSRRVFYNHTCLRPEGQSTVSYSASVIPDPDPESLRLKSKVEKILNQVFDREAQTESVQDDANKMHSEAKCAQLAADYPLLRKYYADLFSGRLGFTKVAEFTSYPRVEIAGRTLWQWPDEDAEETFSVFDHPVVRIYKRK